MSAPSVTGVTPANAAQDIVLGTQIVVTFDQLMDTTSITQSTFSLSGPGGTQILTPDQLNVKDPQLIRGRLIIPGTFAFTTNTSGNTVLTFTPSTPLQPNVTYTVILVGPASVYSDAIKNTDGETLDSNYQWVFTTGDLDVSTPPPISPLPPLSIPLDPSQIKIQQRIWPVGNDLSQEIDIIFPGPIDTTSITPAQVLLSLEPILGDPTVSIPTSLQPSVVITGNTIKITITGWPAD